MGAKKAQSMKNLGAAAAFASKFKMQIKQTVKQEIRTFSQILEADYKEGKLKPTPGTNIPSEAKAMLFIHDTWRVVYISAYFYMLPFLCLYFSAGVSHAERE